MSFRLLISLICIVLAVTGAAHGANLSGDQYLSLRSSVGAASTSLADVKANIPAYAGKVIEVQGVVNGIARSGESASFVMNCGGESVFVRAKSDLPTCIENGHTVRVLVRIGPDSTVSLSDLRMEGAAYDFEVTSAEKRLAEKSKPKPQPVPQVAQQPAVQNQPQIPQTIQMTRQARALNLSSRAMQIYDPYKRAIARFNPRLTADQVDAITCSILAYSEKYGVDPRLVVALFMVESNFKPNATSPKGAMGLGQLMPGTARGLGVNNAYDPVQNVEASIRLISGHLNKYDDLALALSAYNAGPGAVKKYNGVPPYRETQNYIRKVGQIYKALCGE